MLKINVFDVSNKIKLKNSFWHLINMSISRKLLNWYARLGPGHGLTKPPYEHVVQIGDPRLRKISEFVPPKKIKSDEIQNVIGKLEYVLKKYNSLGMSAPQIGVNVRIFVMMVTAKQIARIPEDMAKIRGIKDVPFTVFINPTLKVVNYLKVVHSEGCESVQGYEAEVPRYKEVEVSGYNEQATTIVKKFTDWPARIAQHEMDHLDGKLYVDMMDRKTLRCMCWEEVNLAKGKLTIPFSP